MARYDGCDRPKVLSIAGFDPSGGAGALADIKTFEAHGVYGFSVVTAMTYQNDTEFKDLTWYSSKEIKRQIDVLDFSFEYVKIGLVQNLEVLNLIIDHLYDINPRVHIIWDPIIKASAGFEIHSAFHKGALESTCKSLYAITPNWTEMEHIAGSDALGYAKELSKLTNVLLKGGHIESDNFCDRLIRLEQIYEVTGSGEKLSPKHGSGCVYSSAVLANLALGAELNDACKMAKGYVEDLLASNESMLGYHKWK
ncbi:MAG: hydroxymethylpyrimidine/phosphomethylpyrimidine kinase [Fibrobacterales bacterium]